MNHAQYAGRARHAEQLDESNGVRVEVRFSHERLGAGKAPLNHRGKNFWSQPTRIIPGVHVEHKIGDPGLLDQRDVAIQKGGDVFIRFPRYKVRDGRNAAGQCRRRAARVVLNNTSFGQVTRYFTTQMTVRIDAAGEDEHAPRVDFPGSGRRGQFWTDLRNNSVADTHIRLGAGVFGHNETVAYDEFWW